MIVKIILTLLLTSIVTPTIFANTIDCATVSTRSAFLKKNEYRLQFYHLGKVQSAIVLTPGRHKLSAQVILNKKGTSDNPNTYIFTHDEAMPPLVNFEIDVKKNIIYHIVAEAEGKQKRISNDSFKVSIKKEIANNCEYDERSSVVKKSNKSEGSDAIPKNLQYQLDLVVMELKAHLRGENLINKTVTIEKDQRLINTIGLVANNRTPVTKGINILAVTPFSIAAKIGLRPDDTILNINGLDLTFDNAQQDNNLSKLTQFKSTLVNLSKDEKVEIEIMRRNKKVLLRSDYKELSLPSYQLQIMMN